MTVERTQQSSESLVHGIITGDCECWCLEVTEAEYRAVCGETAWKTEKEIRAEFDDQQKPWRVYPIDLIASKFTGKYCRIRIHVDFVKTPHGEVLDDITDLKDLP